MLKIRIKLLRLSIWTNMLINFIKNKLIYLFFFILFIFIILCRLYVSKYFVIEYDDSYHIFYDKEISFINNFFTPVYHGRYISNFLTKLIGYIIPNMLNIHPILWIQTGGAVICGIFYFIFVCMIVDIAFLNRKRNVLFVFAAAVIYIIIQNILIQNYRDYLYTSFYGFTFPFIFLFAFWKTLILNNIKKQKPSFLNYVLAFLLGMSTEFTAIVSTIALIFFNLVNLFQFYLFKFKILKPENQDISELKTTEELNKHNIILLITMIFSNILYFKNLGFIQMAQTKGTLFNFHQTVVNGLASLGEYIESLTNLFKTDYVFFVLPILLLVLIFIFNKKIKNKAIILTSVLSLFFAQCIFCLFLLFAGVNSLGSNYVNHFDIVLQMNILLLYIFYILISSVKNNYLFYLLLFLPVVVIILLNFTQVKKQTKFLIKYGLANYSIGFVYFDKNLYKDRYINERLLSYWAFKDEKPVLSESSKTFTIQIRTYIRDIYNKDYSHDYDEIVYTPTTDEAYNIYIKDGGREITPEELKHPNFQKLMDKNFVLYGK